MDDSAEMPAMTPDTPDISRPWSWEGNVQDVAVKALVEHGWTIRRVANTASREPGKDIEAERSGAVLWVTVKGYPTGTPKTRPQTQARHWFAHALFDVILWRNQDADVQIAVALPRMPTYENLAARTAWFERAAGVCYLWVTADGIEGEWPLAGT
jgi:hypothetical protein